MVVNIMFVIFGPAMFLLYHSEGCNAGETVFHWCYVNDLRTTHAVDEARTTTCAISGSISEVSHMYGDLRRLPYLTSSRDCVSRLDGSES